MHELHSVYLESCIFDRSLPTKPWYRVFHLKLSKINCCCTKTEHFNKFYLIHSVAVGTQQMYVASLGTNRHYFKNIFGKEETIYSQFSLQKHFWVIVQPLFEREYYSNKNTFILIRDIWSCFDLRKSLEKVNITLTFHMKTWLMKEVRLWLRKMISRCSI